MTEDNYTFLTELYASDIPDKFMNHIIWNIINTDKPEIKIIKLIYENINKNLISLNDNSIQQKINYRVFVDALNKKELHYIVHDCIDNHIVLNNIDLFKILIYHSDINFDENICIKMIENGLTCFEEYFHYIPKSLQRLFIKNNMITIEYILNDINWIKLDDIMFYLQNDIQFDLNILNKKEVIHRDNETFLKLLNILVEKNYNFIDSELIEYCTNKEHFQIFIDNGYDINNINIISIFEKLKFDIIIMMIEEFNLDIQIFYEKINNHNSESITYSCKKLTQILKTHNLDFNKFLVRQMFADSYEEEDDN